jgi:transcriptional regulator with XRE-family HTH domain
LSQPPPPAVTEVESDPELDAVVGANLRDLRVERGLTLDQLAGLSGVGRQTLGQVELGRTMPTVATLWKIAKAFDVPFAALLARPAGRTTRVLRLARAKRLVSADGRFSSRALFPFGEQGRVEFYELWLAGHGREDAEAHAPGTRENLVVTGGRLRLDIGDETFELAKGDAIEFVADVPHSYVNPGSEECWMNLVMTYRPAE